MNVHIGFAEAVRRHGDNWVMGGYVDAREWEPSGGPYGLAFIAARERTHDAMELSKCIDRIRLRKYFEQRAATTISHAVMTDQIHELRKACLV